MENPEYLYHYTSQKGLLGILDKKKLWMTSIMYLNDSLEYNHCLNIVRAELDRRKKVILKEKIRAIIPKGEENIHEKILGYYNTIEHYIKEITNSGVGDIFFVFSLSEIKDDISQWRGYCPDVGGYCIEFDTSKLLSILNIAKGMRYDRCEFEKCIYESEKNELLVKTIFNDVIKKIESNDYNMLLDSVDTTTKIIKISTYIKNDSFKNEREYRLVYKTSEVGRIKYREGKSMIIPYIDFDISNDAFKLPISKIFVGPTPHLELSKMSVNSLLKSYGYKIDVVSSTIPYRSW